MPCCCFIGHKNCPKEVKEKLLETIFELVANKGVTQFFVGTQGEFDKHVYDVLHEIKKIQDIKIYVVLAYIDRVPVNIYFDMNETIFPDELTKTPLRLAVRRRNSYMIEKSDYVIAYLDSPFSNTVVNVEEALRKKRNVINLGNYDIGNIIIK